MRKAKIVTWVWMQRAAVLGLAMVLPACGRDEGQLPVYPVKGEVRLDGVPPDGAFLVFHSLAGPAAQGDKKTGEPIRPSAQVKSDGSFELTTYDAGDGAPAGDYAVTVVWNKLVGKGKDVAAGPNVIPQDYATAQTTPLKVTVDSTPKTLEPIVIQKKAKKVK